MRKVKVKDIKDGMVLAESLKNSADVILMGKGTVLREAFAPRLTQRGVTLVYVEGEPDPEDTSEERLDEEAKIPLEELFERKLVNITMKTLYDALIRHRNSVGI